MITASVGTSWWPPLLPVGTARILSSTSSPSITLAEDRVTPALHVFAAVVEEVVVLHIDEKLGGGGVRLHGARHGDGAEIVLQAIVGLVLNRLAYCFLLHIGVEATTLDHEVIDDAVENGAVVEAVPGVLEKVGDGLGRFLGVQFQFDFAESRANDDHAVSLLVNVESRAMIRTFAGQ